MMDAVWVPGGMQYDDWSDYQGWIDIDIDLEDPEFGWFATKEACQTECDRRNTEAAALVDAGYAAYVERVRHGNAAAHAAYKVRVTEYNALVAAGLREPKVHPEPTTVAPDSREVWGKRLTPSKHWRPVEWKRNPADQDADSVARSA